MKRRLFLNFNFYIHIYEKQEKEVTDYVSVSKLAKT